MRSVQVNLEDDIYFEFVELKAQYKCKTWEELIRTLVKDQHAKYFNERQIEINLEEFPPELRKYYQKLVEEGRMGIVISDQIEKDWIIVEKELFGHNGVNPLEQARIKELKENGFYDAYVVVIKARREKVLAK